MRSLHEITTRPRRRTFSGPPGVRFATLGVALGCAGALVSLAGGCGGDASSSAPADAAAETVTVGADAGPSPTITLVQGLSAGESTFDDTRLCVSAGGTFLGDPSIVRGMTAAPLSPPASLAPKLATDAVTIYLVPLKVTKPTCAEAISDPTVVKLPDIPAGTFKPDRTYVLMLLGCTPDIASFTCMLQDGGPAPGSGVRAAVVEVDTVPVGPKAIGFQFIHAGPVLDDNDQAISGVQGMAAYSGWTDGPEAIGTPVDFVTPTPSLTPTAAAKVRSAGFVDNPSVSRLEVLAGDAGQPVAMSTLSALSNTTFQEGRNYVLVSLGTAHVGPQGQVSQQQMMKLLAFPASPDAADGGA